MSPYVEAAKLLLDAEKAEQHGFPGLAKAKKDAAVRLLATV
jgi:hypothetical protein